MHALLMDAYVLVQLESCQHSILKCHKHNQYITVCPALLNSCLFPTYYKYIKSLLWDNVVVVSINLCDIV